MFEDMASKKKRPLKRKDGTLPAPYVAPEPPPPVTMRVRILRAIHGSRNGTYAVGQSVTLPVAVARSWIESGVAEEDKMLPGAPETKI